MILTILRGVAAAIHGVYPDAEVSIDRVPQGLQPPCFYLETISARERAEHDRRFRLTVPVRVHYFPTNHDAPREECEAVAFRLLDALEFIEADGLRRGFAASYKVTQDEVLMLDVTYRAFYERTQTDTDMRELALGLATRDDKQEG